MVWQAPLSRTTQVNLGETDSLFIGSNVTISVSGDLNAVVGTGSNHEVLVYGTVVNTSGGPTISLGNVPSLTAGRS